MHLPMLLLVALLISGCTAAPPPTPDIPVGATDEPDGAPVFHSEGCNAYNSVHLFPSGTLGGYGPSNWTERQVFGGPVGNVRILLVICPEAFVLYHSTGMQPDTDSQHHMEPGNTFVDVLLEIVTSDPVAAAAWNERGFDARVGEHTEGPGLLGTLHEVHVPDGLVVTFEAVEPAAPARNHAFNQTYANPTGAAWAKGVEVANSAPGPIHSFAWGPASVLGGLQTTPIREIAEHLGGLTIAFLAPGGELPPAAS